MAVDRRSYLRGKKNGVEKLNGAHLFIEAWMRITIMELPLSPTEERLTAAIVETSMKEGKREGNIFSAA